MLNFESREKLDLKGRVKIAALHPSASWVTFKVRIKRTKLYGWLDFKSQVIYFLLQQGGGLESKPIGFGGYANHLLTISSLSW